MLITPKLKIQRSISQASRSERVALSIRERILGGHYKPGAMLPGRRALAAEYEVAPLTIEQAFKNLQGEGLVRSENGRGTFVSDLVSVTPAQFSNVKRSISTRPTTRSIGIVTGGRQMMELIGAKHQRMRIVRSMEQALSRANCMVKFVNGCDEIGNRRGRYEILDDIAEQNLDAIAFVMAEEEFGDVIKSSELKRIPVVLAGNPHFIHAPSVFYDGRDAGIQATSHLIERGCKRIMFFSPSQQSWVIERMNGAEDAFAAAGLPMDDISVEVSDSLAADENAGLDLVQRGYNKAKNLFASGEVTIDGVIAANDQYAVGFIEAASEAGLTAGRNFAIIGFDDDFQEARGVGLTSLHPPLEEMGAEAARLLTQASDGQNAQMSICLHSNLIVRSSTGAYNAL